MKKILIVDDEPSITKAIRRTFASSENEIIEFSRAIDVIKYVQQEECDVVITDLMMPGIKGGDLCAELRKLDPYLQFIVITGYPERFLIEKLLKMGINDILIKPFDSHVLVGLAEQAAARRRHLKDIANTYKSK